jgi:hypothetical protein
MAACIPVKSKLIRLLVKKSLLLKMQQLILGIGTALWWLTEPHCISLYQCQFFATKIFLFKSALIISYFKKIF